MVLLYFRHGARGPLRKKYYNYDDFYTKYPGELTPVGIRQHFLLGSQMREKYILSQNFLSKSFNMQELRVLSTNSNRTLMSAQSLLLGLYPLKTGPSFPLNFPKEKAVPPWKHRSFNLSELGDEALPNGFQPFPIHSKFFLKDDVLRPYSPTFCPIMKNYTAITRNSSKYQEIQSDMLGVCKSMLEALGLHESSKIKCSLQTVYQINSDLTTFFFENYEVPPEYVDKEMRKKLDFINNVFYAYENGGIEIQKRMIGSPMIAEIMAQFSQKITNATPFKMLLYSTHDTSLISLNLALNITNWQCHVDSYYKGSTNFRNCAGHPPYASFTAIELHKSDSNNSYFVKINSNGVDLKLCEKDSITCSLDEFSMRLRNFYLPSYKDQCMNKTTPSSNLSKIVFSVFLLILFAFLA